MARFSRVKDENDFEFVVNLDQIAMMWAEEHDDGERTVICFFPEEELKRSDEGSLRHIVLAHPLAGIEEYLQKNVIRV